MVTRLTIVQLLTAARAGLDRLTPASAQAALLDGACLIDVRTDRQVETDGAIPGTIRVELNHLEWRLDPTSSGHDPTIAAFDDLVVLICDQGFSSSLAAARLQVLGFPRATDVVGGFQAWRGAGLPVTAPRATSARAAPAPAPDGGQVPR